MNSADDIHLWCLEKRGQILERLQSWRDGGATALTAHLVACEEAHLSRLDRLIAKHEQSMATAGRSGRACPSGGDDRAGSA